MPFPGDIVLKQGMLYVLIGVKEEKLSRTRPEGGAAGYEIKNRGKL